MSLSLDLGSSFHRRDAEVEKIFFPSLIDWDENTFLSVESESQRGQLPFTTTVESTIIDYTGDLPLILRPGAVTSEMMNKSTGLAVVDAVKNAEIRVSGSLDSHYAPVATVVLDQSLVVGQRLIAIADVATPDGVRGCTKTHDEFVRFLYAALRAADEQVLQIIVVEQPKGDGIAIAIRDRLKRSSNSHNRFQKKR